MLEMMTKKGAISKRKTIVRTAFVVLGIVLSVILLFVLFPIDWCYSHWRPNNSELKAWGRLQLLAEVGRIRGDIGDQHLLGELLAHRGVAPMAEFYEYLVPRQLVRPKPAVVPTTPTWPSAPPALKHFDQQDYQRSQCVCTGRVRGGQVAATVYGSDSLTFAPCFLSVNYDATGKVRTSHAKLLDGFMLASARLVICRGGRGLLAWVSGHLPSQDERRAYSPEIDLLYFAEAPAWAPKLLLRSDSLGQPFRVIGQTPDGGRVYLRSQRGEYVGEQRLFDLWRVDTDSEAMAAVCRNKPLGRDWLIPSPKGAYLASVNRALAFHKSTHEPLWLVDCQDGSVYILTWRDPSAGSYIDAAVGWSIDVPQRLYFVEIITGRLWQLDLDLSRVPPETPPQGHIADRG